MLARAGELVGSQQAPTSAWRCHARGRVLRGKVTVGPGKSPSSMVRGTTLRAQCTAAPAPGATARFRAVRADVWERILLRLRERAAPARSR